MKHTPRLLQFVSFGLIIGLTLGSCSNKSIDFQRNSDFNLHWKFLIADMDAAQSADLDDADWSPVDLPHDWGTEDFEVQDSLHIGPFFKKQAMGSDIGYLRTGTCWYRKDWKTPNKLEDKQVILQFDGVQTQMQLWVNEKLVGEHVYGYTPFNVNITSFLNKAGQNNIIAIKTVNTGENSRWYAGSGIYRNVSLSIIKPVSVTPWGVFITSSEVNEKSATIQIELTVSNQSQHDASVSYELTLTAPDQSQKKLDVANATVKNNETTTFTLNTIIEEPYLWDTDHPDLYTATVKIYSNGDLSDVYNQKFGIRSIQFSPELGFLLNGKEVLLKGACIHHDNGILGAAAFKAAEYRRVRIMKENGFNAIRTSHNPPSSYFLDACDELGVLVIDEAFDHWNIAKRPNDYSNYFEEWYVKDIQSMVYRDRNHPSIIMWSFGNEIPERADPEGIETGKKLIQAIKAVDPGRPCTQAICDFWDKPGKGWDYSAGAFQLLDVHGYNYQYVMYESDQKKFPDRIIYGSETFPLEAWENWELAKKHKYVLGDFVWTGMDYIGESGIGHTVIDKNPKTETWGLEPWPWYNAWCGDIDLIGNKKAQSYYRDVVWGESKLELAICKPLPEGLSEIPSKWGWPSEDHNWKFPGMEGKMINVKVYSSYPKVDIALNGETIASRSITYEDKYTAEFEIEYAPGTLTVSGSEEGEDPEIITCHTSGSGTNISLEPEQETIVANRSNILFIPVEIKDENGFSVPDAETRLVVSVNGQAELLAAGNGAPTIDGSLRDKTFSLYKGKGLIILRSNGKKGDIVVKVSGEDITSSEVTLTAI